MVRLMRRRGRKRRLAASLVVLLAASWAAGFVVFAASIPTAQPPMDTETDAIVVLTGGSLRLDAGLTLLESGAADRLFVSGVHRGVDVAELMRLQQREPTRWDCCIVLGHDAADTVGNASETADWAQAEGVQSIRLVTAGYHMPRSLVEFRAAMPDAVILPHPVSPDHVKTQAWWAYPGTAALIAGEYMKYLAAWARQSVISLLP